MTALNVTEQGLRYLMLCLELYMGSTAFLLLYLFALAFLCVKGSREERRIFLPVSIFLLLTVYNPVAPVLLMRFFDVNSEYYRFFWITPVVILVPYAAVRAFGLPKEAGKKAVVLAMLVLLFILSGNFLYEGGYKRAENVYKMPPELMEVSALIHADADEEYPKAFLEYEYNMQMRQYDPKILLTIDREEYLYATSMNYTEEMIHDSEHPQYRILAALIKYQGVETDEFLSALEQTHTEYVVLSKANPMTAFLKEAGLKEVAQTAERSIYKYDLKEPYVFELVDYTPVY
ncbi:MAG: hypothetical protein K6D90_08655 [Lachnospiraceae bacterium]|nr:hypothetical protein [Lachnospiraceae bacterium]